MTGQNRNTSISRKLNPLLIIGVLFFVFGFVTWLSSVLIPYLQIACELTIFQSYLVAFAFYISYFVMALPSGQVLKVTGFKNGMSVGLLVMAVGTLIFVPAAYARMYNLFLLGLFIQGTGLAILQTASNPYVTILGPQESAARRISIMGICNGIAGIIAPIAMGTIILDDAELIKRGIESAGQAQKVVLLNALAMKVVVPYVFMGILLVLLAFFTYKSGLPEIEDEVEEAEELQEKRGSIFHFPHLLLGILAIFLYTGVEVIAGNSIITYAVSEGISMETAKFFTSFTLGGMLVGYIIGIFSIPKYLGQQQALKLSCMLGIIFIISAVFTNGYISLLFIALLGIANALIWPSIWPLAISGLGRFTKTGASLLVMAIAGGAVIPLLYGYIADLYSFKLAYCIAIPCYIYIGYYAFKGHKAGLSSE